MARFYLLIYNPKYINETQVNSTIEQMKQDSFKVYPLHHLDDDVEPVYLINSDMGSVGGKVTIPGTDENMAGFLAPGEPECACEIKDREENEEQRDWLKRCMCMEHWMQTDYYQNKLKSQEHQWQFYMNGTFCSKCGAAIGDSSPCK